MIREEMPYFLGKLPFIRADIQNAIDLELLGYRPQLCIVRKPCLGAFFIVDESDRTRGKPGKAL